MFAHNMGHVEKPFKTKLVCTQNADRLSRGIGNPAVLYVPAEFRSNILQMNERMVGAVGRS